MESTKKGIAIVRLVVGIIGLAALVYWWLVRWEAKHEVTRAPREKMFECDKHGLFLEKYALQLADDIIKQFPDGHEERGPLLYCPMCYEQRIKEAQK